MNDLYTDVGYYSLLKQGEQLCGDHVDVAEAEDGSKIIVLADGLGSGVKASILSTLTAKIISTMMARGLSINECVKTITQTLPAASDGVAYSTFTILRVLENEQAELIQYDNPRVIYLHEGNRVEYAQEVTQLYGRAVSYTRLKLGSGDVLIAMSDGVIGASADNTMNPNWQLENVTDFMEALYHPDYSAKDLCTILLDQCDSLYARAPGDDTTVCVVRIRKREPVNLVFGPPADKGDDRRMMELFFSKQGKHIVCGGTTAKIAARFLDKPVIPLNETADPDIPPISQIEGADLVTEGVVTLSRVLEYAENYANDNSRYFEWGNKKDGASQIARILFEKATDVNFFVGRAVNEAHKNGLPVNFDMKMQFIAKLSACMKKMGKNVKVSYF